MLESRARFEVKLASGDHRLDCDAGETLLRAGLSAGLDFPYECASGTCGSCRCKLLSGTVDSLWPEAPGLTERDRRRGNIILMCQSKATSNCVIDSRVRGRLFAPSPFATTATVSRVDVLTHNMSRIVLQPERDMRFLPGQFVIVDVAVYGRRAYSMANVDDGNGELELIVKHQPDGKVSGTLVRECPPGTVLNIEGPYGGAYFRTDKERPVVGIAGGSGIAPVLSVVQAAARSGRWVHLYFGVNRAADVCLEHEFAALSHGNPRMRSFIVVNDGESTGFRSGLVGDIVVNDFPDLKNCDVYIAGPAAMTDSLNRRLVTEGRVDCDRLFFDRFS